ncbi:MAG: N-acetylmuramic acid 6-phosphate etherase [Verrucomicrobia bacterium]|nr:N-acetylmuramic acid 6-phosphate etherase [Verrucomicrobiota bacterium]
MGTRGDKSKQPLTERRNPRSRGLDCLSTRALLNLINDEDAGVPQAVRRAAPAIARAVELAVERLSSGGRLFYIGAGTSGRLGVLDAVEWRPTFGVSGTLARGIIAGGTRALTRAVEGAEDADGSVDLERAGARSGDVVIGISASGLTPFVRTALAWASKHGCATVLVCCTPPSAGRPRFVDVLINPIVGPEILTGSTRMKAGTATKLVLNSISTAVMVRLGKVYDNLMVDVRPTNAKLHRRAVGLIETIGGISSRRAATLLDEARGDAKTAIVMAAAGCTRSKARSLLRAHGGRLRDVLHKHQHGKTA